MNRKRGFTLVELLVVLAIISILATIVVPNVARYLRRAQATRALAEINSMETAFTKMITDADRSELGQLLNPSGVANTLVNLYSAPGGGPLGSVPVTADQFQTAVNLYSRVFYALLRDGRGILDGTVDPELGVAYRDVVDVNAVRRLGLGYLEELAFDPWENLYNIFPGPWPARDYLPVPFRTFTQVTAGNSTLPGRSSSLTGDRLTVTYEDPDTLDTFQAGFPAPRTKQVFIWSAGLNTVSGQAMYNCTAYPPLVPNASAADNYPDTSIGAMYNLGLQEAELVPGGDDINNWDPARTWERFYN